MLAYIGEKIYSWSDPEKLDPQDILDTVALYYLSGSFATSVVIYNQVYVMFVGYEGFNLDTFSFLGFRRPRFHPGSAFVWHKE